jgi:hypothetical protein
MTTSPAGRGGGHREEDLFLRLDAITDMLFRHQLDDIEPAFLSQMAIDLTAWMEAIRPGLDIDEMGDRAYRIVAAAEDAYPGHTLWDAVRGFVVTALVNVGDAGYAGEILAITPDARRAVGTVAAVAESFRRTNRTDMLAGVDDVYSVLQVEWQRTDPDRARLAHRYMRNYFIAALPEILDSDYVRFDEELAVGVNSYDPIADWAELVEPTLPEAPWDHILDLIRNADAWHPDVVRLLRQHYGLELAGTYQGLSEGTALTTEDVEDIADMVATLRAVIADHQTADGAIAHLVAFMRQHGHDEIADSLEN